MSLKRLVLGLVIALTCAVVPASVVAAPADLEPHVQAVVTHAPPSIDLRWQPIPNTQWSRIYRRDKPGDPWVTLTTQQGPQPSYRDTTVQTGRRYEYQIAVRTTTTTLRGYLMSGIDVLPPANRGTVLVVYAPSLTFGPNQAPQSFWDAEGQWELDLWEDGWVVGGVFPFALNGIVSPADVKREITQNLQWYPNVKGIILVGNLPAVHSGNLNVDGVPAHRGAWPADQWYGDPTGTWTDTLDLGGTFRPNLIGDGRFDQAVLPATGTIPVARIDPSGLGGDQVAALTAYFTKNHLARTGDAPSQRTLLTDAALTGSTRAVFGASTAMSGQEPTVASDFMSALADPAGYALATASARGGTVSSLPGIASVQDFATRPANATILALDGSWLGDWDIPQNILTAALFSSGRVLDAFWFDRPTARLHALGAQQSVLDVFQATVGNNGSSASGYVTRGVPRSVHLSLLGDPTVRLGPRVAPPTVVTTRVAQGTVTVEWGASPTPGVSGYLVERMWSTEVTWQRLTPTPITGTSFVDTEAFTGATLRTASYRVVALKPVTTGSGTFFADGGATALSNWPGQPSRAIPLTLRPLDGRSLEVSWPNGPGPVQAYVVERRPGTGGTWTQLSPGGGQGTNRYVDADVVVGRSYEYRVTDIYARSSKSVVLGGIDVTRPADEGAVLLVVDSTKAAALTAELARLDSDLADDGWSVRRVDVNPTDTPAAVKARIVQEAAASNGRLRAALLLGAVPRVFSGCIFPDGHVDHSGAWPADGFYADLDGVWTDTGPVCGNGGFTNRPGDGKYDQSTYPSALDVAVGRVDTEDLPVFAPLTPTDLLRRWLDRNHDYRSGADVPAPRAILSDVIGELRTDTAQAANSLYQSAPLTREQVCVLRGLSPCPALLVDVLGDPDGFAYGIGSGWGSSTSAAGVGTSADFATKPIHATFFGIFGSYHGDWSYTNNLMRTALVGPGTVQATLWAGRPNVLGHRLAALETFGEIVKVNATPDGIGDRVHQGLLGDPTLRITSLQPPTGVTAVTNPGRSVTIGWVPISDPRLVGVVVERRAANAPQEPWTRLTGPTSAATFTDTPPGLGEWDYRLVAIRRLSNGAGTFLDPSHGYRVRVSLTQ